MLAKGVLCTFDSMKTTVNEDHESDYNEDDEFDETY